MWFRIFLVRVMSAVVAVHSVQLSIGVAIVAAEGSVPMEVVGVLLC